MRAALSSAEHYFDEAEAALSVHMEPIRLYRRMQDLSLKAAQLHAQVMSQRNTAKVCVGGDGSVGWAGQRV